MKHEVVFKRGDCVVYRSRNINGSCYYTVVNHALEPKNIHRHYQYYKQAVMICKRAGDGEVPRRYSKKAKRDIEYLIGGTD